MTKIVSFFICLLISQPLLATMINVDAPVPRANTLKLTCIEHDLYDVKKPARIYFESDGVKYTLCDSDGGAMLSLLYSLCLQEPRKHMVNLKIEDATKVWDEIKNYKVKSFERVRQLLVHSMNRLNSSAWGKDHGHVNGLQELQASIKNNQQITYEELYLKFGVFLKKFYKTFKDYPIDITEGSLHPRKTVMGIQYIEDLKDPGYTCVGNTLAFFCKLKKLEIPVSKGKGVKELVVEDLSAIMKAYDVARSPDQNLPSEYHIHKSVKTLPDGAIVMTVIAYPDKPNAKSAYTKGAKGKKKK